MNVIEADIQSSPEEKEENCDDENDSKSVIVALSGFALSVVLIWWALIILVRFYIFDNVLYSLFIFCMLTTGIIFNITSVNILITDFREPINFLPFIIGSPVTIFWTVFCIIWSLFKTDSFSRFAYLPLATYNSEFYDGLGYDSESTTVHPFTKEFTKQSSFFANKELIMLLLVVMTVGEIIFWIYTTAFYVRLTKSIWSMRKPEGIKTL